MNSLPAFGPALRKHLLAQLDQAIEQFRSTLHPEDAQMAPLELRSWMKACDTRWDEDMLDYGLSRTLYVTRYSSTPKEKQLRAMRLPHAIYAAAALKARFGTDRTGEVPA